MSKQTVINAAVGILVVCAVLQTAFLMRAQLGTVKKNDQVTKIRNWEEFGSRGQVLGEGRGPVRIVVFSDYQCPFCKVLDERLAQVLDSLPESVTVLYRHYPLQQVHAAAFAAAVAAECAAEHDKFTQFHRTLFAMQDSIGKKPWVDFASMAGIADVDGFNACVNDEAISRRISQDIAAGKRLDVTGTPSVLINNVMLRGAPPMETLYAEVAKHLKGSGT